VPKVKVCTCNLHKHMLLNNMPVQRLAKAVGVSGKMMRKFIKGESEPDIYTAQLIADVLMTDERSLWQVEIVEYVPEGLPFEEDPAIV
jgi:transcriptional regulator with XRE-family HTH domain